MTEPPSDVAVGPAPTLPAAGWLRRLAIGGCEHAPAPLTLVLKEHGISFEPRLQRRGRRSPAEGTSSEHYPGI
jgi:hypothetical protein